MTALIMDAAERRIRVAGYNGFIFRDLAADAGIKSASIHYHFPTKAIPGAAVLRRHTHHFMQIVNTGPKAGSAKAWREAFVVLFKRTAGCASAACKGRKWGAPA